MMRLLNVCILALFFNITASATNIVIYYFQIKSPVAVEHAQQIEQDLKGLQGFQGMNWELRNERLRIVADQDQLCQEDVLKILNLRGEKDKPFFAPYEKPSLSSATENFKVALDAFEKEFKRSGNSQPTVALAQQMQRRLDELFVSLKEEESKDVQLEPRSEDSPSVGKVKIIAQYVAMIHELLSRDLVGRIEGMVTDARSQYDSLMVEIGKRNQPAKKA